MVKAVLKSKPGRVLRLSFLLYGGADPGVPVSTQLQHSLHENSFFHFFIFFSDNLRTSDPFNVLRLSRKKNEK